MISKLKELFSRGRNRFEKTWTGITHAPRTAALLKHTEKLAELPFKKYIPYATAAALGYMGADLTATYLRSSMIPKQAPPGQKTQIPLAQYKMRGEYSSILDRNIFNSDGLIPDLQVAGTGDNYDFTGPARESTLPLVLVGTIVHANPGKSVATVQTQGNADKALPYVPNDDIESMATLLKVTRKKAFIRNLQSGAIEFIQIKDDSAISFQRKVGVSEGPVQKENEDTFAISRTDLESQMTNLPDLLTQARAVPNVIPGTGGKVDGFRIVDIQENSIFRKFGIDPGDIIKGVNGSPLDSPNKAMEFYNSLRSSNELKLQIERNGRTMTLNYKIR